jgi:hypothetical protein
VRYVGGINNYCQFLLLHVKVKLKLEDLITVLLENDEHFLKMLIFSPNLLEVPSIVSLTHKSKNFSISSHHHMDIFTFVHMEKCIIKGFFWPLTPFSMPRFTWCIKMNFTHYGVHYFSQLPIEEVDF